ncbi:hydroxymethylbilane synthase [Clostridium sp. D2Q-14]|uniref:hydroxymethylbilane synthase n=1 Tax=Anaeromonas gelatinilytica TaxID=2683194 RepID=UPI00193BA21F|nr:hydroxymethylbilane synthase [Anaeromonas gelatinilytica]MBS4535478.1 hydroxymethylbilane synthase [Anaeromonas gelatinilytica]
MKIVVGSRGSKLAVIQSKWVMEQIKSHYPEMEFELKIIKTKGDKVLDRALDKIGDKGIFVKEIEQALINEEIDMAIHSMKDMPTEVPDGLIFTKPPLRQDYRDVMIFREKIKSLDELPKGSIVGTGSKRRKYQLLKYRPDLKINLIRGNVDTRIRKLDAGEYDAIVLAAAGVKRLELDRRIGCYLSDEIMVPSPAQGILAIEIKDGRDKLKNILNSVSDENAYIQSKCERTFLKSVNGGCHIPVGAICNIDGDEISLTGILGLEDGSMLVKDTVIGKVGQEEQLGQRLANNIMEVLGYENR